MRRLVIGVALSVAGCAPETRIVPQAVPASREIKVGQPWAEATAAARGAGYELHDASGFATSPTIDGFYVDLPGDDVLLVGRNSATATVKWVDRMEHGQGPKLYRVDHDVRSFDLPAAPATRP